MSPSSGDPGRVTFLLIGLVTGLVVGGAVSFRLRGELLAARHELQTAHAERAAAEEARDAAERDAATARLQAAQRRLDARSPNGRAGPSEEALAAETPEQRAARQQAEEERQSKLAELMRVIEP